MMIDDFRSACRIHLWHTVHRYLMSNAEGRWDGAEKARRHRELCQFYVAVHQGLADPCDIPTDDLEYLQMHEDTQQLTDRLDETIGFPLTGRPDYELLVDRFFDRFHDLALQSLSQGVTHA